MASIRKRGESYIVEVFKGRDMSGKKITECATFVPDPQRTERQNEKALRRFADEFEEKVKNGQARGDVLTFERFAREWMSVYAEKELEPTTFATYSTCLNILFERIGYMKLSEIRPMTVQGLLNDLREKGYKRKNGRLAQYSQQTIRTIRIVLSSVLSAAVEDGLIVSNPCAIRQRKRKKERVEHTVNTWTPEQAQLFMDMISKPIPVTVPAHKQQRGAKIIEIKAYQARPIIVNTKYRCFYAASIYSGCRRGELVAIKWNNIDFEHNTIRIAESAHYTAKTKQYDGAPKTQSAYRTIILPAASMRLFRQLKKEQAEQIMNLGTAWIGDRSQKTGYVFAQENGLQISIGTPNKEFRRILNAINASLPEAERLPVIHLHDLRHTSASIMIAAGLDPVTVAARLGHSDPTTTLKIYAHSFEEHDQAAADALEQALKKAKGAG